MLSKPFHFLKCIIRFFFGSFLRCLSTCFCGTALLALAVFFVVGWKGSDLLLTPPRRVLHDYHKHYLEHPEKHSLNIEHYEAYGRTPCLIVTRDRSKPVSYKGESLIKELNKRQVAVGFNTYGTIVMVHGRTGRKEDLLPVAERFCSIGFRCICIDLPAHGEHPNTETCYGDTEVELIGNVYKDIKSHLSIDESEPEFIYGFSMGGSVAIRAAAQDDEWDGIITLSTFANLKEIMAKQLKPKARQLTPLTIAAIGTVAKMRSDLDIDSINSEHLISGVQIPTLIVHGEQDDLIPMDHSDRLYNAISHNNKLLIKVPEGTHHNALSMGGQDVYLKLSTFLLKHRLPERLLAKK